jgi:hypothetical protein
MLTDSKRIKVEDQRVNADVSAAPLSNRLFIRLVAKDITFTKVDFKYSIFDTCYLRRCRFDTCDFTGCRFTGTNLYGSQFAGCNFDYAVFERTIIDSDVLNTNCPGTENRKMRFARTLRMNFQQLGDWQGANLAIQVELEATEVHLRKAARSNEAYYRKKYTGWNRVAVWIEWIRFKALDVIWGNGESIVKLLRAVGVVFLIMFACGIGFGDYAKLGLFPALFRTPAIFLGTVTPEYYPVWFVTSVVVTRLIAFGFFMSIILKRFNRR